MKIYNTIIIPKGLSQEIECDCQEEYNSGYSAGLRACSAASYDEGYEDGYESGSTDGWDTGYPSGYTDGVNSVVCEDCSTYYDSGYTSGYTDGAASVTCEGVYESGYTAGEEAQKSKMTRLHVLENGDYTNEDGWNRVRVTIPIGPTPEDEARIFRSGWTSGWTDGYPSGYTDGVASVICPDCSSYYDSGYTSGLTDGYQDGYQEGYSLGEEAGYDTGYEEGYGSGYTSGRTDGYDDGWAPGYNSGYTDGINAAGGDYASGYTDGFGHGYESGSTDAWQPAYDSGHTDGYDEGYNEGHDMGYDEGWADGFEDGYTSGGTDAWQPAYNSGYTDGAASVTVNLEEKTFYLESGFTPTTISAGQGYDGLLSVYIADNGYGQQRYDVGFEAGENTQKSLLSAITITGNGSYTRADGYSAITVNVAQTGHTDQELTDNWNSGYTSGLTDGFNEGHTSGYTDGENAQKALLSNVLFVTNGTYSNVNGWSSVTVSVAQTGYTQQDLDNAYASGLTNGYNSGWTGGYDSGYTDGYASGYTDGAASYDGYERQYLTIEALSAGTLYWDVNDNDTSSAKTIEWSKDDGLTWNSVTATNEGSGATIATVQPGDKVLLRGDNASYGGVGYYHTFKTDFPFNLYGNINSLLDSTDFWEVYDLSSAYTFNRLFEGATGLVSAVNLMLPATGITSGCYRYMFSRCTSLTTAPPILPATNTTTFCYMSMFQGCSSLTAAPVLPSPGIGTNSYLYMFRNCNNLRYIKCMATTLSPVDPTGYWVDGVGNTGTFVKAASMTGWTTGADGIPQGWTVLNAV